jgi:hypothetical protein
MSIINSKLSNKYIICGRGQCNYNSEGNKVFRKLVATHLKSYMTKLATRKIKSSIIRSVTNQLISSGMIFLTLAIDGITLVEISSTEARKKVAHRFRDAARESKHLFTVSREQRICLSSNASVFSQQIRFYPEFSITNSSIQNQESLKIKSVQQTLESPNDGLAESDQLFSPKSSQPKRMAKIHRKSQIHVEMGITNHSSSKNFLSPEVVPYRRVNAIFPCLRNELDNEVIRHEALLWRKIMVYDLVSLIDSSPNIVYGEDFDDISTIIENSEKILFPS